MINHTRDSFPTYSRIKPLTTSHHHTNNNLPTTTSQYQPNATTRATNGDSELRSSSVWLVNSPTPPLSNTNGCNLSAEFSAESSNSLHSSPTASSSSPSVPDQQHTPTPSTTSIDPASPSPPIPPAQNNNHPMVTRTKNNISNPNSKYNYAAALTSHFPAEPNTLTQALKDKQWRGSMSTEIDAFARNGTYQLVPRQPHYNVIGCRWLYKNKFNSNGTHRCCKSLLVAKGYNQEYGRDYTETFSPVIKSTTLRLILDIAASNS